jgi:transcriptional antiterminator RfaH
MDHWYVFHTKPHKERQVAEQLHQRRYEVFLPTARACTGDRRAARERPYFPCYLFVKLDLNTADADAIQWLPGLRCLVRFGGQPASVPDNFVHELRRRMAQIRAAGGLVFEALEPGMPVKITSGPFAGYEAVFDSRLDEHGRVRVLLEWIGQTHGRAPHSDRRQTAMSARLVPVEVNASHIEKARPERSRRTSWKP